MRTWQLADAGGAINLTGAVVKFTVRDSDTKTVLYATSTDEPPSDLYITPLAGRIDLLLPYTYTETMPVNTLLEFDIEVTHPGGIRITYELQSLTFREDVTHA